MPFATTRSRVRAKTTSAVVRDGRTTAARAPKRRHAPLPRNLADRGHRVRGQAYDCRLGAIARQLVLDRVEDAEREAGPDRRAEIERHPGDLVLPFRDIVRHGPTRARVTQ